MGVQIGSGFGGDVRNNNNSGGGGFIGLIIGFGIIIFILGKVWGWF